MGAPTRIGQGCTFRAFKTDTYKLHFLESPSGLKVRTALQWLVLYPCLRGLSLNSFSLSPPPQFLLTTAPSVGNLGEQLHHVYAALFVDHVAKNPLYTPGDQFL